MRIILITTALALLLAGCGRESRGDGRLLVVATTPQLGDFARHAGGDRVDVETLVEGRTDPHDYEPRPSDLRALAEADVVLRSGGEVDDWLGDVVDGAGGDAEVVDVGERIGAGGEDPHWWQDPRNAIEAVGVVSAALGPGTRRAAAAYARTLAALDREVAACMRSIPRERRKLVTDHDAFGWFARRYDIEVLGAILPGGSTSARPSARDVRELVDVIRREGVTTIFPESALDQRLQQSVARAAGVRVGEPLYADVLGPDGTYAGTLRHDAAAMARGFGGACDL